jgi:polysaccharide biosynthesis/export protein
VFVTDQGPRTEKIFINLQKAISGEKDNNILLKENDYLFVRMVPEWDIYKTVNVSGEVAFPGKYTIKKGEKLSSLIERAGGFTDNAFLRGAVFIRERVKLLQQQSITEMINRLERDLFSESSLQVSSAVSTEEIAAKKVELDSRRQFIDSLKTLQGTGRMTIMLAHSRLLKGSEYDIELEENDSLFVPAKNSVVNVVGSVMSQSSLIYSEKLGYKDYIEMTGGYSQYADTGNVYVLKVDGSARKLSTGFLSWNPLKARWEAAPFGEKIKEIEPGDSIIVPEQLSRVAWLRELKDITQILMQAAVTAGVVLKLYQ